MEALWEKSVVKRAFLCPVSGNSGILSKILAEKICYDEQAVDGSLAFPPIFGKIPIENGAKRQYSVSNAGRGVDPNLTYFLSGLFNAA